MDKDYGPSIRSGFETTGIHPISVERALAKLPKEVDAAAVESAVQLQFVQTLEAMRYHGPTNKAAARPKKNEKLPPGASYTCKAGGGGQTQNGDDSGDSSDSSDSDSDEEEEGRRVQVNAIVDRLDDNNEQSEDEDGVDEVGGEKEKEKVDYAVGTFIVAVYQKKWYVGKVLNKEEEPEAVEDENYIMCSFMEQLSDRNCFRWPVRLDVLNMVKDDVLFTCQPPVPSSNTSSTRVNSFMLTWKDFDEATKLFEIAQASYPTKIYHSIFSGWFVSLVKVQCRYGRFCACT